MCGIVSIFSEGQVSTHQLTKAMAAISHRGPDESNFWISNNKKIGIGHVRLNIIDLEGGKQPISNNKEDSYIIANGEFYEYENTKEDLKAKGFSFKTNSDSEVALHLYSLYGAN